MKILGQKRCTQCKKWKSISEFHKAASASDGHQYHCKKRSGIWQVEHVKKPEVRERLHRWWKKHTYGMTQEEFDLQSKKQKGRCSICGEKPTKRGLFIDHNHETGQTRGLVCIKCNLRIGWEEHPLHSKVVKYLDSFKEER